jgi:hypothetical protein
MIRTVKQSTGTVPRTTTRIHAADLGSLARSFVALASLTIVTLAAATSWDDDSHYQLGVEAAPTIDVGRPQNIEHRSDDVVT